ncbi:MAG: S8 family serine peptidase [Faecousia sp.]
MEKLDFKTEGLARNVQAMAYRADLEREQATMEVKIARTIGHELDVAWNLTLAANMISAWVAPEEIERIAALPGVKQVFPETRYEPCAVDQDTVEPNMATSSPMIGANAAWAAGYTGRGQRIAVIDTGLDTDHQSVDEGAFLYALGEDEVDLMDQSDVAAVLQQLNIYKGYANSTGQIVSDKELTADKLYISAKIPFGYNYVDRNLDVTHDNDQQGGHGSHVAGIAAGNRYIPDGEGGYVSALDTVFSQGVAPDAQLLVMKVFGTIGGGYTSDIVVAVEDALVLGCDSINMSMGSGVAGFTDAGPYQEVFERLEQSDTIVSISAGNNGSWADHTGHGYLYAEDVNLQTAAEPGTHSAALTVASVENDGMVGKTFQVGEKKVAYAEVQMYGRPNLLSSLDTSRDGSGTELEYVHLDAYGSAAYYEGINVMGKVVFVSRGNGVTFKEIHSVAAHQGAIAVVVYNNEPGPGMKMDVTGSGVDIPIVGITQKDGEAIKAASTEQVTDDGWDTPYYTGKMTVFKDAADSTIPLNSEYYTMSDFSSWGAPGTLTIKPEITAPGGNIYSINGETKETDQYFTMSGTSMAAPQVAGMAAVLAQYLDETGLDETTGLGQRKLSQNLLMSTATPIVDKHTGLPYPVLQQGAGLANLEDALNAESFITIGGRDDGKVKVELGDDPDNKGVYTFEYTIHNFTDKAQNYVLDGNAYTQSYFEDDASFKNKNAGKTWYMDYTLKELGASVSFAVNGQVLTADGSNDLPDLDGDNDADRADAQALLDLATGKLTALVANQEKADLSGDNKITAYDAELYLEKLGSSSLPVPANGSVTVTVTIALTEADKAELDKVYTNGAYIEAYVTAAPLADAEGKVASTHTIPVLAFYGDWSDPSMFDQMTYSALLSGNYTSDSYFTGSNPYSKQMNFNYVTVRLNELAGETYLGGNPFIEGDTYNPDRNAISSNGFITSMNWSLIRNAADFRAAVENTATGEAYYESIRSADDPAGGWDYAAAFIPQSGAWYYVASSQELNEDGGGWQPGNIENGTELTVKLQAAPEYYLNPADASHKNPWVDWNDVSDKNALSIPVAVDNEAPTLDVYAQDDSEWGGKKIVYVSVQDNRYTAAVLLMTPKGGTRLDAKAVNQANKGESVTLEFDVTDIWGSEFQIIAVDYAGNMTTRQASFGNEYYGPTAKLLGPTTDTGNWPDMSSSAQWDRFDSNTNLDYEVAADANTGVYAAAYGDGYLFYVGYMRKDGKLNYNLYALDYPSMENPVLVGESVSFDQIGAEAIRSMTYVPENGGRLYYIKGGTKTQEGYENYQLRSMDVATGQDVGLTYYFPEYGDMFKLTPTSIAYSPMEGVFYLVAYEDGWAGKNVNLYRFELPTDSAEIYVEYEKEIGVVYSENAEEWDIDPDLAMDANPDRTSITVGGEYEPEIYLSIRSSDGKSDYLYTYNYGDLINTGIVRAHNALVLPVENEQNNISRSEAIGLQLNAPATEVFQGGFLQLGVTIRPWCLDNKALTWESSNTDVATVDATGRVTGVSAGTATITVTTEAEPKLTQSVDVTVKAPEFKLSFTGAGEDGVSRMFTRDFMSSENVPGAALTDMDGNPITSAASDLGNYGYLWVQDQVKDEYRLHKIDPATGKSVFDSEPSSTGSKGKPILFNDLSYDDGDETTSDSEWIFATDGQGRVWCTQNREKPNTMMYVMESEDAPINFIGMTFGKAFDVDGTTFYPSYYLEPSSNKLVMNNFSYSDFFGWSSSYTYFKLSEQFDYLTNHDGRYLDNLTYDSVTNSPILLHYNGESYDVYWLSLDATAKTATLLNLGTIAGYTDVAGYTAEYYGDADIANAALDALLAADEKNVPLRENTPAQGSLNAVSNPGKEIVEDREYATLTITAEEPAASGMITVELDENLTLVSLTSPVELNSYSQKDNTITFGYAASSELAKGATLAVLHLTQTGDATATVTETERGGEIVSVKETVTFSHTHSLKVINAKDATCTEDGYTGDEICTVCGETVKTGEVIPALGHQWGEWTETKAPTCTEKGQETRVCQRDASHTEIREIEALGHKTELKNAKEATCTEKGYTGDEICTVCGETPKKGEELPALGHDFSVKGETVAPTETEDGYTVYKCSRCDATEHRDVVPATGHKCASEAFTDLRVNQWYHPYTDYVIDNGLMNGVGGGRFNPNGKTTRAMLVTTLYRMAGEPEVAEKSTFTDVSENQWYAKAVAWAQDLGIATGVTDTTFCPNASVTREQAATFLYRYVTLYLKQEPVKGADLSVYKDADKISGYAKEAIAWATAEGLFNGFENGTLQPKGTLTRVQMAKLLTVLDQKF